VDGNNQPNYKVNRGITYLSTPSILTAASKTKSHSELIEVPLVQVPGNNGFQSFDIKTPHEHSTPLTELPILRCPPPPAPPKLESVDRGEQGYWSLSKRLKIDDELGNSASVPHLEIKKEEHDSLEHLLIKAPIDLHHEIEYTSEHDGRLVYDYNHAESYTRTCRSNTDHSIRNSKKFKSNQNGNIETIDLSD